MTNIYKGDAGHVLLTRLPSCRRWRNRSTKAWVASKQMSQNSVYVAQEVAAQEVAALKRANEAEVPG